MEEFLDRAQSFSADNVMKSIFDITQYNRIQGSKGLVDAAKYVYERVKALGVNAKLIEEVYDGEQWYLTLQTPVAWELIEGSIEFGDKRLTTSQSPLLVLPHSPSGSAEGEVVPIDSAFDGKIAMAGKNWKEAYKRACDGGAKGFIAYRAMTGEAFPYIGLFLRKKDLKYAEIPAVAVPESMAREIENKRARISVKSEMKAREVMPIVYAEVGKPPFILFSAHICHPEPGANDNASGSAMLIELARTLAYTYDSSSRFGFAFLWVPEYYGTQAFIEKHADLSKYYACINLDMVGGSCDRSGSHIMVTRTPLSRFSILSGLLEYYLNAIDVRSEKFSSTALQDLQFKAYPYEIGSDHDIFNFFGVPSAMLITWPDRYYHSSGDRVENLSSRTIEIIGKSALATALALAKSDDLQRFAKAYAMKYIGESSMGKGTEVTEKLVSMGLSRDIGFLGRKEEHKSDGWLSWKRKGVISEDLIKDERFKELADKNLANLYELLMLGELLPEKESFKALREEFGEIDEEALRALLSIISEAGIVDILR